MGSPIEVWRTSGIAGMLQKQGVGRVIRFRRNSRVYVQGDAASALFYVTDGRILLTTVSSQGKEGVVGVVGAMEFFGECCVTENSVRPCSAIAFENSLMIRIERQDLKQFLRQSPEFSELFIKHLAERNQRTQEDLADLLFSPSERRLARVLMMLAQNGGGIAGGRNVPRVSQSMLASMVGTTRSRISFFLTKFKRAGVIEYDRGIRIDSDRMGAMLCESNEPASHLSQ